MSKKSIFIDMKNAPIQVLIEGDKHGARYLSKIEKCPVKINQEFKEEVLEISLCAYRGHDNKGNTFPLRKEFVEKFLDF